MHAYICNVSKGLSGTPAHVDIIEAGEEMGGGSPESLSLSSRRLAAAVPSYRQCIYTHGICHPLSPPIAEHTNTNVFPGIASMAARQAQQA